VDTFSQITRTAKQLAEKEIEALAGSIKQLITDNGGTIEPQQKDGRMQLNVGGTVFSISVKRLLHRKMKTTYLSTLLLHFTDQLPKDENNLPFLEMHPAYFRWLRDELALLESPHLDEVAIHSPQSEDPSYSEYHSLFMQSLAGEIDVEEQPQAMATSAAAAAAGAAGGGAEQADMDMAHANVQEGRDGGSGDREGVDEAFEKIVQYMSSYWLVREELQRQKEKMEAVLTAMRPFVKGDSSEEDIAVMSLTVEDEQVSILRRNLAYLGPNHALVRRYNPPPAHTASMCVWFFVLQRSVARSGGPPDVAQISAAHRGLCPPFGRDAVWPVRPSAGGGGAREGDVRRRAGNVRPQHNAACG